MYRRKKSPAATRASGAKFQLGEKKRLKEDGPNVTHEFPQDKCCDILAATFAGRFSQKEETMHMLFYPLWPLMALYALATLNCSARKIARDAGWVQHG